MSNEAEITNPPAAPPVDPRHFERRQPREGIKTTGKAIQSARRARGMRQEDLVEALRARRVRLSRRQLARYENDIGPGPSVQVLRAMAEVMGVRAATLVP